MRNTKKLLTTAIIYILLCSENIAIFGAVTVVSGGRTAISGQATNARNSWFTSSSTKNSAQKTNNAQKANKSAQSTTKGSKPTIYQRFQNIFSHSKTNKPVEAIPVKNSGLNVGEGTLITQKAKLPEMLSLDFGSPSQNGQNFSNRPMTQRQKVVDSHSLSNSLMRQERASALENSPLQKSPVKLRTTSNKPMSMAQLAARRNQPNTGTIQF